MKVFEIDTVEEMTREELTNTNGGRRFWGGFFLGYVISGIIDGIYEAAKDGCLNGTCSCNESE